jgi:hypothetical protein
LEGVTACHSVLAAVSIGRRWFPRGKIFGASLADRS